MKLMHTVQVPAGDGPFPTVVALHGWGASAHDLLGLAPVVAGGETLFLCPQGSLSMSVGPGQRGHGWFPLEPGEPADPRAFADAVAGLEEFLDDALERYPADPERRVLLGFSQGGALAYAVGLGQPERWSGIAALASWLPPQLAERIEKQDAHDELPLLILHGTKDPLVPVERARESRETARPFGVRITYREQEMGHELNAESLKLIDRWLETALSPRSG